MQQVLDERCGEYHAITDVYCEKRHAFLVNYPTSLVVGVVLIGVIAFMLVGFLGYGYNDGVDPKVYQDAFSFFGQPWPLYLWFVALLVTLQVSILRNVRLRGELIALLIVTLVCTALVGLGYVGPLQELLKKLLGGEFIRNFGKNAWTWTIINFFIIIVFIFDTVRRWAARALGQPETGDFAGRENDPEAPTSEELASGDLLAGTILFLLMALFFTAIVIGSIARFAGIYNDPVSCMTQVLNGCNITPDTLRVPAGVPLLAGMDLSRIDQILGLICLPLAFLVLAVSATLSGVGAVGAVDTKDPRLLTTSADGATENVSAQVSMTVLNTLRAALDRRIRIVANRILASLRTLIWPILVFFAVFALNRLAGDVQIYLHNTKGTLPSFFTLAQAAAWAAIAILSAILSVALLLFDGEVAVNALRFMGWIGFVLLLTFWAFAVALFGFNQLLNFVGIIPANSPPSNAFALSISTAVSLLALLGWVVVLVTRTMRGRTAKQAAGASASRSSAMLSAQAPGARPGDSATAPVARPPEH